VPKRYGTELRRAICARRERVSKLSKESGASPGIFHLWKRQALIDAGLMPDTKSVEVDASTSTIEVLEAAGGREDGQRPVQQGGTGKPKRRCQVGEALSNLGPPSVSSTGLPGSHDRAS
jgi:transposase-like protein